MVIRAGSTALALALVAGGGCNWTAFDDLREEAWVHATDKPENASTNWGVAIVRSARGGDGGRLAVLGTQQSVITEVELRANGDVATGTQRELDELGIGNLEPQPILLADPTTDELAVVTLGGSSVIVAAGPLGELDAFAVFGASSADAATYMVAPGIDGGATPQPAQPIVASLDVVFGTFYTPPEQPFVQPRCTLRDGGDALAVRAMAAYRAVAGSATDDVVIWESSGKVYVLSGQIFNGARGAACPDLSPGDSDPGGTLAPAAILAGPLDVGFLPSLRSQIHVVDGRYAILMGHADAAGFLGMVDLQTMTLVGAPHTEPGLKTAAVLQTEGRTFVAAGYPTAVVDGLGAGRVLVYEVDPAAGIATAPVETLHDAQPEEGQAFGRGLAALPFNGQAVLAVSGDNEAFVYYRTNSYGETRTGR